MWVRTSLYWTHVQKIQCDQVFHQRREYWNENHCEMRKFPFWLSSDYVQCLRWMYACWLDSVLSEEIHLPLDKFLWALRSLKWDSRKEYMFGTQFVEPFCAEHERYEHRCQFLHQRLDHEETEHIQGSYTQCLIRGTNCKRHNCKHSQFWRKRGNTDGVSFGWAFQVLSNTLLKEFLIRTKIIINQWVSKHWSVDVKDLYQICRRE